MKLAKYLKPYTLQLLAIVTLIIFQAVSNLALPGYMSDMVNIGIAGNGTFQPATDSHHIISQNAYIFKYGGLMTAASLISAVCGVCSGFLISRVAAGFARDLRKTIFSRVLSFSSREIDNFSVSSLITRCTNDIQQLQMFLSMGIRSIFFAPVMGIGAIIKVIGTEAHMSRILAVSLGVVLFGIVTLFSVINEKFQLMQRLTDKLNMVTREALTGMAVIRAFSSEGRQKERFDETNTAIADTNRFVVKVMGSMFPLLSLIMNLTGVAIIYYGAKYVNAGFIQAGDIMAFLQYSNNVIMSFIFLSMFSIMLPRAAVSAGRIKEVLDCRTSIENCENPKSLPKKTEGLVEFRNVSFKYPGAEGYVLRDISFTARPGETTAFIGATGSGKSTIINLIPRLYDATEGEVLFDGINVKELSLAELRSRIAYAPQKALLFSGTIESNIKFSDTEGNMEKAAQIAQAEDFISEKEGGFEASVSQGGGNLSGGQRQRLSIARALYKDAVTLIFDDTFSALDYKTDSSLRKALAAESDGRAMIIVAQRISTIRHAHKIIVVDEGRISGVGTHNQLIENNEIYRQLASSQLS